MDGRCVSLLDCRRVFEGVFNRRGGRRRLSRLGIRVHLVNLLGRLIRRRVRSLRRGLRRDLRLLRVRVLFELGNFRRGGAIGFLRRGSLGLGGVWLGRRLLLLLLLTLSLLLTEPRLEEALLLVVGNLLVVGIRGRGFQPRGVSLGVDRLGLAGALGLLLRCRRIRGRRFSVVDTVLLQRRLGRRTTMLGPVFRLWILGIPNGGGFRLGPARGVGLRS